MTALLFSDRAGHAGGQGRFDFRLPHNAGVPREKAGPAAALINVSSPLGATLRLAVFSAVATCRTNHLRAGHIALSEALTSGFRLVDISVLVFSAICREYLPASQPVFTDLT